MSETPPLSPQTPINCRRCHKPIIGRPYTYLISDDDPGDSLYCYKCVGWLDRHYYDDGSIEWLAAHPEIADLDTTHHTSQE